MRTDPDAADVHLASIHGERMRQLTAELQVRLDTQPDEMDAMTARLLLADYTTAVAHLRAVARMAAARIDAAPRALKEVRRFLHRYEKLHRHVSDLSSDNVREEQGRGRPAPAALSESSRSEPLRGGQHDATELHHGPDDA